MEASVLSVSILPPANERNSTTLRAMTEAHKKSATPPEHLQWHCGVHWICQHLCFMLRTTRVSKRELHATAGARIYIKARFHWHSDATRTVLFCFVAINRTAGLKTGGRVIRSVKYADDLVLLAKEETVLQGVIDRLIESWKKLWDGRECGRD
jgi:hypothetical protein